MSLEDEFVVKELKRDRYSREGQATSGLVKFLFPCHGVGIRSKKDLDAFVRLRLTHPTERLGFCVTQLATSDSTFIWLKKRIEEEKYKFKPTAKGTQLQMFVKQTMLAVLPSTGYTYYYDKDMLKKILTSMETPKFLKEFATELLKKAKELGTAKSEAYQNWKKEFFENKWLELNADANLRKQLINENYAGQNTSKSQILIPPTPPVTPALFYVATKIIEETARKAKNSASVYFQLPFSILKDVDMRKKVLDYCDKTDLSIVMLMIKGLDQIVYPDRFEERTAFSEIQERFCNIRKKNKCTILLEGGKLTYPSLVRGFDIVENHFSGKNERGGKRRKNSTDPIGYSSYYIREKMIFYSFPTMVQYADNHLKITKNEHGLMCPFPCCKDVKSLRGGSRLQPYINRDIWNFHITRPHYALNMNDIAKIISELIYNGQIQKTKDVLLKSDLCILKNLIPDV